MRSKGSCPKAVTSSFTPHCSRCTDRLPPPASTVSLFSSTFCCRFGRTCAKSVKVTCKLQRFDTSPSKPSPLNTLMMMVHSSEHLFRREFWGLAPKNTYMSSEARCKNTHHACSCTKLQNPQPSSFHPRYLLPLLPSHSSNSIRGGGDLHSWIPICVIQVPAQGSRCRPQLEGKTLSRQLMYKNRSGLSSLLRILELISHFRHSSFLRAFLTSFCYWSFFLLRVLSLFWNSRILLLKTTLLMQCVHYWISNAMLVSSAVLGFCFWRSFEGS